jgi:hypothetical protein
MRKSGRASSETITRVLAGYAPSAKYRSYSSPRILRNLARSVLSVR